MLLAQSSYDELCVFIETAGITECLDATIGAVHVQGFRRQSGSGRLFFFPLGAPEPISLDLNAAVFPLAVRAIGACASR